MELAAARDRLPIRRKERPGDEQPPVTRLLEMLGQVYGHDAAARERSLTPNERLRFHQEHSGPVMDQLHQWLDAQLAEKRREPNSGWARRSHIS